jgi:SAM-dependent methyltransferase
MTDAPRIYAYDYYAKLYAVEEAHWWQRGMRDAMDAVLGRALAARGATRDLAALDLGCGTGYLLQYARRYTAQPVIGLDISAYGLAFCQQRGAHALIHASAVQPPFASASFDLVFCIDTLQHVSPRGADRALMRECARLLRPNGLLFIRTNSALGHAPLHGADDALYRRYRRGDLITMARDAGLHVERASYVNLLPSVWGMIGEYRRAWRRGAIFADAIGPGLAMRGAPPAPINALLHGVLFIEAALIRWGIDLPFGHSQILLARKKR